MSRLLPPEQFSASREFRLEIARDPAHAAAWAYLGDVLMREEKPAEAARALEKAVKLDPKIRLAHLDLGILSIDSKQYERRSPSWTGRSVWTRTNRMRISSWLACTGPWVARRKRMPSWRFCRG